MSVFNFDGYSEFEEWCVANNYHADEHYDVEEESHKRDTVLSFYVKNNDEDTYAEVNVFTNYDHGWNYGTIEREGLKRVEKQIITTQVAYE